MTVIFLLIVVISSVLFLRYRYLKSKKKELVVVDFISMIAVYSLLYSSYKFFGLGYRWIGTANFLDVRTIQIILPLYLISFLVATLILAMVLKYKNLK